MRTRSAIGIAVVATVLVCTACSTAVRPARFTLEPTVALDGPRKVWLVAVYQRDRILEALRGAGFEPVADPGDAIYELEVLIGAVHQATACGTLNNVRFRLEKAGVRIAEIAARGWTAACTPNVLDEVSQLLASRFTERMSSQ